MSIFQLTVVHDIDGLVQDCSYSIADPLELLQFCTKPLIYPPTSLESTLNQWNIAIDRLPWNPAYNYAPRFGDGGKAEAAQMRGKPPGSLWLCMCLRPVCITDLIGCQALRPMGSANWGWLKSSWESAMYSLNKIWLIKTQAISLFVCY